jgi:hypothetical protein
MEGVGGHHGAGQVQGLQERGEMAGLVVPVIDLEVIQQAPPRSATPSRWTRVPSTAVKFCSALVPSPCPA